MAALRAAAPTGHVPLDQVLDRVRNEFLDMPGLRLTDAQARRLWHLDAATWASVLDHLVEANFLSRDGNHRYGRATATTSPLTMVKAALEPHGHTSRRRTA
jgi:hypothetical protein